jgi:hypothetical protein
MRSNVVLPAPFGPTIPKKDPAGMSSSMSSTATVGPKRLLSPRKDTDGTVMRKDATPCGVTGFAEEAH